MAEYDLSLSQTQSLQAFLFAHSHLLPPDLQGLPSDLQSHLQAQQAGWLLTPSPTPEFSPQRASSSACDQPPTRPSSRATTGYMADDDGIGGRVDSPLYYDGEVSDLSDQVDTDYLGLPAVSDGESEISDFDSEESEEYSAVGTGKMTGPPHKHTHKCLLSDTTPNQSPDDPTSIPYNVQPK
ncbi:hypothetical protein BT96DRAFT_1008354 [Gymnopus androsaceus JB14]|uniref:Uncharacterized protein n=1 Tax=Gymnopus androsaceus JB14 TaxID=1447944 RepID=A0A6A4GF73_9AGAR|nr:hypothetical protein BT96DRAFT_1008354 [Gymnopus androsaceus JB14]